MARGFSTTAITESQKSFNSIATLVEVIVDPSDPGYMTDFVRPITTGGKTYAPMTGVIGVSEIRETSSTSIESVNVSLTGIPDEFVKLFLDHDYIDRPVKIYKIFLDADGTPIGDARMVFDGNIESSTILHDFDNETATVSVSASSHWVDFTKKNGRLTNDNSQQTHFNGDSCFQFAIEYDREIKWGQS